MYQNAARTDGKQLGSSVDGTHDQLLCKVFVKFWDRILVYNPGTLVRWTSPISIIMIPERILTGVEFIVFVIQTSLLDP